MCFLVFVSLYIILVLVARTNCREIYLNSSSKRLGMGSIEEPFRDLESALLDVAFIDDIVLHFLDSGNENAYMINKTIVIQSLFFSMGSEKGLIRVQIGSEGSLMFNGNSNLKISNIKFGVDCILINPLLELSHIGNILIENITFAFKVFQGETLLLIYSCEYIMFKSIFFTKEAEISTGSISIGRSTFILIDSFSYEGAQSGRAAAIGLHKNQLVDIRNLTCINNLFAYNSSFLQCLDVGLFSIIAGSFYNNTAEGEFNFISITNCEDHASKSIIILSLIFQQNWPIAWDTPNLILSISNVEELVFSNNLFKYIDNFFTCLCISNVVYYVKIVSNLFFYLKTQVILQILSTKWITLSMNHFELNQFNFSGKNKPSPAIQGGSVVINDFIQLDLVALSIVNSVATDSNPAAVHLESSVQNISVKIVNYLCFNNILMGHNICSSMCLFLGIDGIIKISNFFVISSENLLGKGNICLNSDSVEGSLEVENSIFLSNKASREALCFKYYGKSVTLKGLIFDDNKNPSPTMNSENEAGALHLGCERITIVNSTILNGTANNAAGILIHNMMGKGSQMIRMENLFIKYNSGESTAAISFHSSIGIIDFEMANSVIANNSVQFHAVVSFFFSGVIGNRLRFYNLDMNMNMGRSIGGCFFLASIFSSVYFENCIFLENSLVGKPFLGGAVFLVYGGDREFIIYTKDSKFSKNYCDTRAGAILVQYGQYHDQGSRFEENYSPFAGTLSFEVTAVTSLANTSLTGRMNTNTGAIYLSGSARLIITAGRFFSCRALYGGGVITAFGTLVSLKVYTSYFSNNEGISDAPILHGLISKVSKVIFFGCEFRNNSGGVSLILALDVDLSFDSCLFENNPTGIFEAKESILLINNSVFTELWFNDKSKSSSIIKVSSLSQLIISKATIDNRKIENSSPALFTADESSVKLLSTSITNINFRNILVGSSSDYYYENITFSNILGTLFLIKNSRFLILNRSNFDSITSEKSIISVFNLKNFKIADCKIKKLNSSTGLGAISVIIAQVAILLRKESTLYVSNSSFEGCFSKQGGVFKITNANFEIAFSNFTKNRAEYMGGALHIVIDSKEINPVWNLFECNFQGNSAGVGGGAIKFNGKLLNTGDSVFSENYAEFGTDLLSSPSTLALTLNNSSDEPLVFNECKKNDSFCILSSQISGMVLSMFAIEVKDSLGQTYHEQGISGKIEIEEAKTAGLPNYVEGTIFVLAKKGVLIFDLVKAIAKPGVTVDITANIFVPDFGHLSLTFPTNFRKCIIGEIEIKTMNICYRCPEGTFSLSLTDEVCSKCIPNVKCHGGDRLELAPGFWRSNPYSLRIYSCNEFANTCMGGYEDICAPGYTGILCSECQKGSNKTEIYFKQNIFLCENCNMWRIYVSLLVVLATALILLIIIRVHKKSTTKNAPPSIGKILSTHLQFAYQMTSQGSIFPPAVKSFTNYLSIGISSEGLFNILSCMQLYLPLSLFVLRIIISIFSMLSLILGLIVFWCLVGCLFKKTWSSLKNNIVSSMVVLTYFLHGTYVDFFVSYFSCKNYENAEYLSHELTQECWDEEHTIFTFSIILPLLFFWMFLLPFIVFWLIKRHNKNRLMKFGNVVQYFINGFRRRYYYWEFVLLIEKYIIIILPALLKSNTSLATQILYAFLMLSFLIIHIEFQPYTSKMVNRLQFISFYSCLISYIVSITTSITNNYNVRLLLSIVYFLFNGAFYLFWAFAFYKLVIRAKFGKMKCEFMKN